MRTKIKSVKDPSCGVTSTLTHRAFKPCSTRVWSVPKLKDIKKKKKSDGLWKVK